MPLWPIYIGAVAYACCVTWLIAASIPRKGDAISASAAALPRRIWLAALATGVSFASTVLLMASQSLPPWLSLLGIWAGSVVLSTLAALGGAWWAFGCNKASLEMLSAGDHAASDSSARYGPHS